MDGETETCSRAMVRTVNDIMCSIYKNHVASRWSSFDLFFGTADASSSTSMIDLLLGPLSGW